MMPGVTHLPVPSMIVTPAGRAVSEPPTATILPSANTITPFSIRWPVAVRIVAPRMAVGRDGRG